MRALNQVVRRCVLRGTVMIWGARYFAEGLEALNGVVLDIVVRPDGSAFADSPVGQVALVRVS